MNISVKLQLLLIMWLNPRGDEISGVMGMIIGIMVFSSIFWVMNFGENRPANRNTDLNDWQIKAGNETYRFRGRKLSSVFYSRKIFPNGLEIATHGIYKTETGKYIYVVDPNPGQKKITTYNSPKDLMGDVSFTLDADSETIRALLMEAVDHDPGFRSIINIINSEFPAPVLSTNRKKVIEIK